MAGASIGYPGDTALTLRDGGRWDLPSPVREALSTVVHVSGPGGELRRAPACHLLTLRSPCASCDCTASGQPTGRPAIRTNRQAAASNQPTKTIVKMTLDQIREDFALLDDWEDRYRYVIELGRKLPEFPEDQRNDNNKVRGCASQVWLHTTPTGAGLHFDGDSDAHIVRGLIAILLAIYQDRPSEEILTTDAEAVFNDLGLKDHLTPQRSNGLASMVQRIRADAAAHQSAAP